jgi:hypothetical protein
MISFPLAFRVISRKITPISGGVMKLIRFILFCATFLAAIPRGFAADPFPAPPSSKTPLPPPPPNWFERYYEKVSDKFDSGAVNFMAGWTELVSESADHFQQRKGIFNRLGYSLVGAGKGLVYGALDTVFGAVNMVSAPIPQLQIPLPQNGVDLQKLSGQT